MYILTKLFTYTTQSHQSTTTDIMSTTKLPTLRLHYNPSNTDLTIHDYINQLDDYMVLNDITCNQHKLSLLTESLDGSAATLLQRYIKQNNITYQQCADMLVKRYNHASTNGHSNTNVSSIPYTLSSNTNDSPVPPQKSILNGGSTSTIQSSHNHIQYNYNNQSGVSIADSKSNNIQWLDLSDKLTIRDLFRHAASSVWIICSSSNNQPVGFTAISLISVSIDPPIITFNISKTSSSLSIVLKSMRYSAHLLGNTPSHISTAKLFASKPSGNRFNDKSTWSTDSHSMPVVHNHIARLSGKITTLHDAGDSFVAVCNVESLTLNITGNVVQPLLYYDGLYQDVQLQSQSTGTQSITSTQSSKPKRQIHLNAFQMCCVGHQNPGQWTNPADTQSNYCSMSHWIELAQILDEGGFDCLFLADVLGVYDVYQGSRDAAVQHACQIGVNDPLLHISAMSAATKHLGFGVTVSTTYELPYSFARKMSTLDHLTNGRIAWNVVTSYLESAAINLGLSTQVPHDERYDIAEEFLDVCYKLWESSWEDNAVVKDRLNNVYTIPEKVHDIKHQGKHYSVPGIHLCEPSPQRTPVIFQAGASSRGQQFAGRHAEAVFVAAPTPQQLQKLSQGVRSAAYKQGRNGDNIRIFTMLTIIVGETDEQAEHKLQEYMSYASSDGALSLMGGWTGVDLSTLQADEPLKHMTTQANHSALASFTRDPHRIWSKQDVADHVSVGGRGGVVVGSVNTVCNELERFIDTGDIDGFNLCYMTSHDTFKDIVKYIVPELRRRGRMAPQPQSTHAMTLRERLVANTNPYIEDNHPAAEYRRVRQEYSEQTDRYISKYQKHKPNQTLWFSRS